MIFTVVFKLLLPYFFQKEISFILSVVLGFFCQSVLLYRTTIKYDKCKNNFNEYKFLLLKYKRFPLFKMPQNIISMINMHLPIFLLGIQVSSNDVGYYVMARTILLIPITFFSQVVGDVLYPRFSEKVQRNENVFDLLYKSTALLLLLALIISMVIYFYGDYLFPLFLGSKWQDSGIYASYLLLWFVINFINRPFVDLISPLKLDWILFVNSLLTISIMIIFFYCSSLMKLDVKDILIIYSIISFVPQFILMIYVFFKAYDLKRE
ncbi:hypothetical protein CTM80_20300 [Photobacterium phosphoreum]|nr:hypothetical protein CTM80_20300 [Photobacterium phosphoreum]